MFSDGRFLPLRLPRSLALLDQLPKLTCFAQLRVFRDGQFGPEQKIAERVLVQDAMDRDALVASLKIDPVISRAIAIQLFALALDHAKALQVKMIEVLRQNLELSQQIKLQFFRQRRYLCRAQFVEDDLEHCQSNVDAPDAAANASCDFPSNRTGSLGQFGAGNFLLPVASH
jgi:hypothetical protein